MNVNKRGQRQVWLAVALSVFTVAWGGNEFTPLLVLYREQGIFSDLFIDMMLVCYAIGVAVGLLGAGPLSDRFGRRALMLPAPLIATGRLERYQAELWLEAGAAGVCPRELVGHELVSGDSLAGLRAKLQQWRLGD